MKGKLAKQHGFDNWGDLRNHLAEISPAEEAAAPEEVETKEDTAVVTPTGEEVEEDVTEEVVSSKDKHLRENVIKSGGTPREDVDVIYSNPEAEGVHPSVKDQIIYTGKDNKPLPVKYGLVRIDDVLASHRYEPGSEGLVSNEDRGFPSVGQERKGQYESPDIKARINRNSEAPKYDEDGNHKSGFLASAVVDPSHDPNSGPPIVTTDAIPLGGNERTNIIKQLVAGGHGKILTDRLKSQAKSLGLDPDKVDEGWMPARIIQKNHHDMSGEELAAISSDLNADTSKGKNKSTVAGNVARELSPVLKHLSDFHVDTHTSINAYINRPEGKPVREALHRAVGSSNPDWFVQDGKDKGKLTPEGKAPLNRALAVSALNGNSNLYNFLNKEGVKSQGDKYHNLAPYALAAPLVVKEGGEKFDLSKELELAADAYKAVHEHRDDLKGDIKKTFNNSSSAEQLDAVVNPRQGQLFDPDFKPKDPHPIADNPLAQWLYHAVFEGSLGSGKGATAGEDTVGKMTPTGIKDLFKEYLGTLQDRKQTKLDLTGDAEAVKFPGSAIEALRRAYKEKTGEEAPESAWGVDPEALDKQAEKKGGKPEQRSTIKEAPEPQAEKEAPEAAKPEYELSTAHKNTLKKHGISDWAASEGEEKAPTKSEQKKVQTKAINALKADDLAKSAWKDIKHLEKKFDGKFSDVEVLAFNDKDHAKKAFDGDDPHGESVFGEIRSWDDVKGRIKPGMSLEFRMRVDGDGLKTHLLNQGMDEAEADKYLDRFAHLEDPQSHIVTVPGKSGGPPVITSPDGRVSVRDTGGSGNKKWGVFTGEDTVPRSTHNSLKDAAATAKEEHGKDWVDDDAPEAVSVEDVTHDDTPLTKAEQAEVDELEKMLGGDSAGVSDLIQKLNDGC